MESFTLLHWILNAVVLLVPVLIVWMLWRILFPAKGKPMVCTTCGHYGPTRPKTRGSLLIEIFMWMLLIVPGVIYSLWRLTTRQQACTTCGGTTLVPADTPAGRKLLNDAKQTAA